MSTSTLKYTQTNIILNQHAATLIKYAESNEKFSSYLHSSIPDTFKETGFDNESVPYTMWLHPSDSFTAERRLIWLLNEINERPKSETMVAQSILAKHRHREMPKNPLFGIIGVAIIGPTLGLINSKKKKRNKMCILITQDSYKTLTSAKLVSITNKISLQFLSKELKKVSGNAYRLEPDVTDWIFSDRETTLATLSTKKELVSTVEFLKKEKLSYEVFIEDNKVIALAISPTVEENILEEFNATKISN